MRERIEQILPLWGMEPRQLSQIYTAAWEIVPTTAGEKYVEQDGFCFFLSRKLQGSNIVDIKDQEMARKMGCAIARLHKAFLECEREIAFSDNSLLDEMKGWVRENLAGTSGRQRTGRPIQGRWNPWRIFEVC